LKHPKLFNNAMTKEKNRTIIAFLFILLACGGDPEPATFTIHGVITENGQGISGIPILANNEQLAITVSDGTYSIEKLLPATYTIKPDQAARAFAPSETDVTIGNADADAIDFIRIPTDQIFHKDNLWTLFNAAAFSVKVNNSTTLQLDLVQNALWYQASQGGLVYRSITGDFTISATVNAVKKTDNTQAVACNVCLGGLMARNPSNTTGENYVHLVSGFTPDGLGYEVKNTTNNVSPYEAFADGSAKHDLRIRRVGGTFTLYQKLSDEVNWNTAATFTRTDLPATLMVGVNIYTAQAGAVADLSVIYENIIIE
jgi:hypothetical protein